MVFSFGFELPYPLHNTSILRQGTKSVRTIVSEASHLLMNVFFRALNPHVKDDKRDFTKEAKLLLNAIMVSKV